MDCTHEIIAENDGHKHCTFCGTFIPQTNNNSIVDPYYSTNIEVSPFELFRNMKETYQKIKNVYKNPTYELHRNNLIEWVFNICMRLGLSKRTAHVATFYIDKIMNETNYPTAKYQVIGLSCLFLASKYSELDIQIPFLQDYLRICRFMLDQQSIKECEMHLLRLLNWNLRITTVYEMVMNFLTAGVIFTNDTTTKGKVHSKDALLASFYAKSFTDFVVCSKGFLNFDYDEIALSIIYCARKSAGLNQEWSDELKELTSSNLENFSSCREWASKIFGCFSLNNELAQSILIDSKKEKRSKDIYEIIFRTNPLPISRKRFVFSKRSTEASNPINNSPLSQKIKNLNFNNQKDFSKISKVELLEARTSALSKHDYLVS